MVSVFSVTWWLGKSLAYFVNPENGEKMHYSVLFIQGFFPPPLSLTEQMFILKYERKDITKADLSPSNLAGLKF